MKEFRCKFCHKLLFYWRNDNDKQDFIPVVAIKCPKCREENKVLLEN